MALETLQRTIFLTALAILMGLCHTKDVMETGGKSRNTSSLPLPLSQWTPAKASRADGTGPLLKAQRGEVTCSKSGHSGIGTRVQLFRFLVLPSFRYSTLQTLFLFLPSLLCLS